MKGIVSRGAAAVAYDPVAMENARQAVGNSPRLSYAKTAIEAALKTPIIFGRPVPPAGSVS